MILKIYTLFKPVLVSVFLLTIFGFSANAQRVITGKVTDVLSGESLIGASVVVTGKTNIGTVTDFDGNYELQVPDDAKQLTFSYVGYTEQIMDISGSLMNVQLSAGRLIEEVVVVGYGTQKTKEVTSAITSVSAEDFNQGNINNATQLLQGKVPGLSIAKSGGDPNSGFNIRLRGISTFGSNTQPLLILDGIVVDNFDAVDPQDIESFSVLKDASAAAIYGTRASNGVILIKTKGGSKEKSFVEYKGQVSLDQLDRHANVLSADEYKSISRSIDFVDETEWFKVITRDAITQAHGLSYSGGTPNSSYRVSANYRNGEGVALRSGFEQYNGRLNFNHKAFNNKLNMDFTLSSTLRNEENPVYDAFGFATVYNPTAPIYTADEEWAKWGGYFQQDAFNFFNPLAVIEQNLRDAKKLSTLWKLGADYNLLKNLKYSISYAQTSRDHLYSEYFSKKAYWSPKGRGDDKGYAGKYTNNYDKKLFETMLEYNLNLSKFESKLLGGYSYQDENYQEFGLSAGGFLTDGFSYHNIDAAKDITEGKAVVNSYKDQRKLIAFFGRLTTNYDNTYFLTANLRREGSTMFGENNKWGWFYGVSGGIDVSRIIKIPFIDRLKLRAGYGITGNLPPNPYLAWSLFNQQGSYYSNGEYVPAYGPNRNENDSLKWETKADLNIGFDLGMLDYKMNISFDYYQTNISDLILLFNVRVPPNPFPDKYLNLGELATSGIDLGWGLQDIALGPVKWSVDLNFSKYFKSYIKKITSGEVLAESERIITDLGAPNLVGIKVIKFAEGEEVGQIIGPVFDGIDENGLMKFKDIDGNGQFEDGIDVQVLGSGLPDYTLGLNNAFKWGNLDFNFFFRGVFGHSLLNVNNAKFGAPNAIAVQSGMKQVLDFADAIDGPTFSDVHVEDASFVKLDNASLGYTFNTKSKMIQSARIYVTGQNLLTFTNYTGIDPEVRYEDGGSPLSPGIDRENTYVRVRGFTFGLDLKF